MMGLAWASLGLALLPLGMALVNLWLYRAPHSPSPLRPIAQASLALSASGGLWPPRAGEGRGEEDHGERESSANAGPPHPNPLPGGERGQDGIAVSILIPARNEETGIAAAVEAALANPDIDLEVVVLDDQSTDRTVAIVRSIAARDPRVRLEHAPPLPPGWSGKQHACHVLAGIARHRILLFQDADVRLEPGAVGRMAAFLRVGGAGLVSGFPRQETGTLGEALVIPLIHLLLLGYLPMAGMRLSRHPGFGAACGQLILVDRDAYAAAGGHAAIRTSLHDGVTLPRAFRRAGLATDLFDATGLARCRMYRGFGEVWAGFSKNATEGMATSVALPVWTALLFGGHVLPWLLLALSPGWVTGTAVGAGVLLRLILAVRFRQSVAGALLHPVGVAVMLAIQWTALVRAMRGRPALWRGRAYPSLGGSER